MLNHRTDLVESTDCSVDDDMNGEHFKSVAKISNSY